MVLKVYGLMWAAGLVAAAVFYLTGNLTPLMQIVFGFLTFGMIFMGMMFVLPTTAVHHPSEKH